MPEIGRGMIVKNLLTFWDTALEGLHENFSADHLHFRSADDGKRRSSPGGRSLPRGRDRVKASR
jgi:hypothetical protein